MTDTDSNIVLTNGKNCSNKNEKDEVISQISKKVLWSYSRVKDIDFIQTKGPITANMKIDVIIKMNNFKNNLNCFVLDSLERIWNSKIFFDIFSA